MTTREENDIARQLWDYTEGNCTDAARLHIEQLLQRDADWQRIHTEVHESHALLTAMDPEAPSMRFTQNVLDAVMALQPKPLWQLYVNKWFGRTMIALYVLPLLVVITGIVVLMSTATNTGSSRLQELFTMPDVIKPLTEYIAWFWVLPVLLLADAYKGYRRRLRVK